MCGIFDPFSSLPITELEEDGFSRTFKELLLVVTKINSFVLFFSGNSSLEKKIFPEILESVVSIKFDTFESFNSRVINTFSGIL